LFDFYDIRLFGPHSSQLANPLAPDRTIVEVRYHSEAPPVTLREEFAIAYVPTTRETC
jgi:hypothetical protein